MQARGPSALAVVPAALRRHRGNCRQRLAGRLTAGVGHDGHDRLKLLSRQLAGAAARNEGEQHKALSSGSTQVSGEAMGERRGWLAGTWGDARPRRRAPPAGRGMQCRCCWTAALGLLRATCSAAAAGRLHWAAALHVLHRSRCMLCNDAMPPVDAASRAPLATRRSSMLQPALAAPAAPAPGCAALACFCNCRLLLRTPPAAAHRCHSMLP